ncbi:phosphate transport system regulatory protein PhoU [Saccharomonospora sp. CUA-673]|uniref:phosphate signaling complex protein PhoU n=1 Tax=Saccharomonospora sp. CUA-673 TaxID=1904969 RepID=UPI000966EFF4|nr:phosphate signaling complex protein PhoU [Saccharomonospora sp. CUA-673]OLT46346.1 phosphate transport system regulatory protein PhoU [Saccharomonospora sp. CUA-673]
MRDAYNLELDNLRGQLGDMVQLVAEAMERATKALLEQDLALAEQVISDDVKVDDARSAAEEKAYGLLALQAPVATDLRIVVASLHAAESIERMGDLALHVAKAARRRHPNPVLPEEVRPAFERLGQVDVRLARQLEAVVRSDDAEAAKALEGDDDEVDEIHRNLFTVIMDGDWEHGVSPAVDLTLLSRFYERYADHAVSVARRMLFVVTGRMPNHSGSDI